MSKLLKLLVCGTCLLGAFLPSNLVVAAQAEDEAAVDLLVGVMPATDAAPIF